MGWREDQSVRPAICRLAWLPTSPNVLEEILRWCGFPHTRVHYIHPHKKYPRIQVLGARDARTFGHFDKVRPPQPPRRKPLWKRIARRLLR